MIIVITLLAACVQPIEPTPTPVPPTSTPYFTPTPPPTPEGGPTFPPSVVAAWIQQNLGVVATNLQFFTQYQFGPQAPFDDIVGYTFQNGPDQRCAGFAQAIAATGTVLTADFSCVALATPVIRSAIPFALLSGQFYQAHYGYIDPAVYPTAGGVALTFPDGTAETQLLSQHGFVILRPQLDSPIQLDVVDTGGNTLLQVPIR